MQETRFSILLDELAAKQEATIAPYLLADGTKVWVRKAGRHNARWRYALLGMVARYLKLGVLKPVTASAASLPLQPNQNACTNCVRQG